MEPTSPQGRHILAAIAIAAALMWVVPLDPTSAVASLHAGVGVTVGGAVNETVDADPTADPDPGDETNETTGGESGDGGTPGGDDGSDDGNATSDPDGPDGGDDGTEGGGNETSDPDDPELPEEGGNETSDPDAGNETDAGPSLPVENETADATNTTQDAEGNATGNQDADGGAAGEESPGGAYGPDDDQDSDGIGDHADNCPKRSNRNQLDTDMDGIGDVCDEADPQDRSLTFSGTADGSGRSETSTDVETERDTSDDDAATGCSRDRCIGQTEPINEAANRRCDACLGLLGGVPEDRGWVGPTLSLTAFLGAAIGCVFLTRHLVARRA